MSQGKKIAILAGGILVLAAGIGTAVYFISKSSSSSLSGTATTTGDATSDDTTTTACPDIYVGKIMTMKIGDDCFDLSGTPDPSGKVAVKTKTTSTAVKWMIIKHSISGKYALKHVSSGATMTCGDGLDVWAHVIESPPKAGRSWEALSIECHPTGLAFKTNFGRYVGVNDDYSMLTANAAEVTETEIFSFTS